MHQRLKVHHQRVSKRQKTSQSEPQVVHLKVYVLYRKETTECSSSNVYDAAVQVSSSQVSIAKKRPQSAMCTMYESKSSEYLNIFLSQTRSGFYRSREEDSDTA